MFTSAWRALALVASLGSISQAIQYTPLQPPSYPLAVRSPYLSGKRDMPYPCKLQCMSQTEPSIGSVVSRHFGRIVIFNKCPILVGRVSSSGMDSAGAC